MSPEVGRLDVATFEELLRTDPDAALALLADLTGATDPALRRLARRLAGRISLRLASRAGPARQGLGERLRTEPWRETATEIDLDASLDALVRLRSGQLRSTDELRGRAWARPATALCLLVDRSGSMGGERLATAALAAAAVAYRCPADHSVLAFADEVLVLASQACGRAAEAVVTDLLALRGFGPTDLAAALTAAAGQLRRSRARRCVTLLLSDCRATAGADPRGAARALDELVVLTPADDPVDAEAFACAVGGRCVSVAGPAQVPTAVMRALDPRR